MSIDESLTNWEQLIELLYNYLRRIEDTALCEGAYAPVSDQDEELGVLIWTLQKIYYQHQTEAEKEAYEEYDHIETLDYRAKCPCGLDVIAIAGEGGGVYRCPDYKKKEVGDG